MYRSQPSDPRLSLHRHIVPTPAWFETNKGNSSTNAFMPRYKTIPSRRENVRVYTIKKTAQNSGLFYWYRITIDGIRPIYFLYNSSDTVRTLRPLARRLASTRRPLAVDILRRKPCLLTLFLFEGWNVLFIALIFYVIILSIIGVQN